MFKQSEITAKCACDAPETVGHTHGSKRFILPKGIYGDRWLKGGYYIAYWETLHCEVCGNRREDFIVYKWHSDGSGSSIDSPFNDGKRTRQYPDVYKAIKALLAA